MQIIPRSRNVFFSILLFFCMIGFCLFKASMRLSMVPSIRSRRVVSNGVPHLSVAHDSTCFVANFGLYERGSTKVVFNKALKHTWGCLPMVPSISARRVVSNASPHLFVAYDLTCFMTFFERYKLYLKHVWTRLSMLPSIRSRRVVSNVGPHLSPVYDFICFMTMCEGHRTCVKRACLRGTSTCDRGVRFWRWGAESVIDRGTQFWSKWATSK